MGTLGILKQSIWKICSIAPRNESNFDQYRRKLLKETWIQNSIGYWRCTDPDKEERLWIGKTWRKKVASEFCLCTLEKTMGGFARKGSEIESHSP